jgi:hypothetical protein
MKGRSPGSKDDNISGTTTFHWLHGHKGASFFLQIKSGPMDARFHGKFSADGNVFSGGWRPNPGADEVVNAPYDITVKRIDR